MLRYLVLRAERWAVMEEAAGKVGKGLGRDEGNLKMEGWWVVLLRGWMGLDIEIGISYFNRGSRVVRGFRIL
jgi:hypothetical protein